MVNIRQSDDPAVGITAVVAAIVLVALLWFGRMRRKPLKSTDEYLEV